MKRKRQCFWITKADLAALKKLKKLYRKQWNSQAFTEALAKQGLYETAGRIDRQHYQAIADGCREKAKARGIRRRQVSAGSEMSAEEVAIAREELVEVNLWFTPNDLLIAALIQKAYGLDYLADVVRFVIRARSS